MRLSLDMHPSVPALAHSSPSYFPPFPVGPNSNMEM
jgi:hypothetical protein